MACWEERIGLKKIIVLDPKNGEAWANLGMAYAALERKDDAREALIRARRLGFQLTKGMEQYASE